MRAPWWAGGRWRGTAPGGGWRRLAVCLLGALLTAVGAGRAAAQEMTAHLDHDTLASEPHWIFALRPALGVDPVDGLFPELGASLGYQFENHAYLGLHMMGRLLPRYHFRVAPRLGFFFEKTDLAFGLGVSPGLLVRTQPLDVGACITWGADVRLRVASHDYVLVFSEFDLLFEALGFDETTWLFGAGVGWAHAF
jgi:hypothetical protein